MDKNELLAEISQFPMRYTRDLRRNGYYFAWNIKCYNFNTDRVKHLAHVAHGVPEKYDARWDDYLRDMDRDDSLWNMLADELLHALAEGIAGSDSVVGRYSCAVVGRSGGWLLLESYKRSKQFSFDMNVCFDGAMTMLKDLGEEDEETLQALLDVLNFIDDTCKNPTKTMEEQYAFHYSLIADEWACAERDEERARVAYLTELHERDQPVI